MAGPQIPKDFRRVIVAASVGNVIEWYDFYILDRLGQLAGDEQDGFGHEASWNALSPPAARLSSRLVPLSDMRGVSI